MSLGLKTQTQRRKVDGVLPPLSERVGRFAMFVEAFRTKFPECCGSLQHIQVRNPLRQNMLRLLGIGRDLGLSVTSVCQVLQISRRRYYDWHDRMLHIPGNGRSSRPYNALSVECQKKLLRFLKSNRFAGNASARWIAAQVSRELGVRVSHVTVWRYRRELKAKEAS